MSRRSTLLKELLRQRHWQTYGTFRRQYDEAADAVDATLVGRWPSRGQFARWLGGDIKGLPHPDHCRVLEAMFPGLTVQQLFGSPAEPEPEPEPEPDLAGTVAAPPPYHTAHVGHLAAARPVRPLPAGRYAPGRATRSAPRPAFVSSVSVPVSLPMSVPVSLPVSLPMSVPVSMSEGSVSAAAGPTSPGIPPARRAGDVELLQTVGVSVPPGSVPPAPAAAGPPAVAPAAVAGSGAPPAGPPSGSSPARPQVPSPAGTPQIPAPSASPDRSYPAGLTGGGASDRPGALVDPDGRVLPPEVAMSTEESARFVRDAPGGVDHDVLDQLSADVRQLATAYLTRPPLTLFRPLSRLRAEVFTMLDRRQRPGLLPPLYAVAGRLCALLAHACADLGHGYAAETHTRTAWLCADLADDDSLRSYVRWVQSNVAYWNGDFREAAQIASSGQRYATKGSNLLRLASQEARAWAACAEADGVERALTIAERSRDRPQGDDQPGVFRFDPGKAAYYASEVRLALGGADNTRLAAENARDALAIFDLVPTQQRSPELVAAARLDLANAYLAMADLDGAAVELRTVLRLPVESRTEPIVGRVASAGETLRSSWFTHSALALELRDEIALFRAYPARRDMSEALD